jgi:hypothetical protein
VQRGPAPITVDPSVQISTQESLPNLNNSHANSEGKINNLY